MIRDAIALVVAVAMLLPASAAHAQDLTVSVAISMREAVAEIGRAFTAARPGVTLRYNLGSSGELQKQIEAGAPVDVFIAAAQRNMDELQARALIVPQTRRTFARNVLVAVKPADSRVDLARPADLLQPAVKRIVIGNPKTVPAGQYAEESLRALGLWDAVRPRLVFAENVRQALEYVARAEVDAGFVYATDALARGAAVKEAFRPPEDTYRTIVYPAAVVEGARRRDVAQAFVDFLTGAQARAVLTRAGFQP